MDEKTRPRTIDWRMIIKKARNYFAEKLNEKSDCGKCAVCHRVCRLMPQEKKERE